MKCCQSDARNKVIAPIFKWLGIIDQWGNGLKLIANELNEYYEIDFKCREVGLSFQVQFVKFYLMTEQKEKAHLGHTWGTVRGRVRGRVQGRV